MNREYQTAPDRTALNPVTQIRRVVPLRFFDDNPEWEKTFDRFLGSNGGPRGPFQQIALGSMACTFVQDRHLGQMLSDRFPNYGMDVKQTKRIQQSFAGEYRHFVDVQFGKEKMRSGGSVPRRFTGNQRTHGLHPAEPIKWNHLEASVSPYFRSMGKAALALDLTKNETLVDEWQETLDFLRSQRLRVHHISGSFIPHVTIFKTRPYQQMPRTIVERQPLPDTVLLNPPIVIHTAFGTGANIAK